MNSSTSTLIAVGFEDRKAAEDALGRVYGLTYDGVLELADAVVVTRELDGEVKLSSEHSGMKRGATGGAAFGALIGMLFLAPLLGLAFGAAGGALGGAAADSGVEHDFMRELGAKLEPGKAAVIALVDEADMEKILPRLGGHDGHVIRTSLSQAEEERLRAAVAREKPLEG